MSSARRLVESSGSFWKEIAPLLANYVKQVNLGGYDRIDRPIESSTSKARHFLINETAFESLSARSMGGKIDIDSAYTGVQEKWIARLPANEHIAVPLSVEERSEAVELVTRISAYGRTYRIEPCRYGVVIPATGRLEAVEIDLLADGMLGEVKAGGRPFRSIDFRQLMLSVIALRDIAQEHRLVLMNPREGTVWSELTYEFIESVCVRSFAEFMHEATFYLSDSGTSA